MLHLLLALVMLFSPLPPNHTGGPGKVVTVDNFSSGYVKPRRVDVWLPESYGKKPGQKFAVLYMHDGQNLFDAGTSYGREEWQVDETLTQLMQQGKIEECIVVGIWNTERRFYEYGPQKPFDSLPPTEQEKLKQEYRFEQIMSDSYLRFIVQELKPYIDKNYNTKTGRAHTFLMGSSMGGLISLYGALEYPNVFGGAACLSTHWPFSLQQNSLAFTKAMAHYISQNLPKKHKPLLYFDYGTETLDAWYAPHQQVIDSTLRAAKYNPGKWVSRRYEGAAHSEASWRERLEQPLLFLLGR